MADPIVLTVNEKPYPIEAEPDTALLLVLRNELGLNGPQFGCGLEQCGACMVLVGATAQMSCRLPIKEVGSSRITTLEGLGTEDELHPIQRAFLREQAAQCGYCSNGMMMSAAGLLNKNPNPSEAQIKEALDGNLCRCGSHLRIVRAVQRAAQALGGLK